MLSGRCRKVKLEGMICIDPAGLGLEVKDEEGFPERWAIPTQDRQQPIPKSHVNKAHDDHAAVENTFVQFYPALKSIAQKFGTYRQKPEN